MVIGWKTSNFQDKKPKIDIVNAHNQQLGDKSLKIIIH